MTVLLTDLFIVCNDNFFFLFFFFFSSIWDSSEVGSSAFHSDIPEITLKKK